MPGMRGWKMRLGEGANVAELGIRHGTREANAEAASRSAWVYE